MEIIGFALGARFAAPLPPGGEGELPPEHLERLRAALPPEEMAVLWLYGGVDAHTCPQQPVYIAVIMGGRLKRTRAIHRRLERALGPLLCKERPFIESNRIAHLEGLACYAQP